MSVFAQASAAIVIAVAQRESKTGPYWRQVSLGGSTGAAQRHARSQVVRRTIVEASAGLFAELGYPAVSLSMIAERSGVSKGSLAFHFSSKLELAHEVVAEMRRRWHVMCADIDRQQLDPLAALIAEVDGVLEASFADPIVLGGYRLAQDPAIVADEDSHFVVGERRILHHITAAAEAGQLAPGVEPEVAARFIMAVISGHGTIHARHPGQVSLRVRMAEAWNILLPNLANPSSQVMKMHTGRVTPSPTPRSS